MSDDESTSDAPAKRKRLTRAELDERAALIVARRRLKLTFEMIGDEFNITAERAGQIYRKAMASNPLTALQVDEHRLEEVEFSEYMSRHLLNRFRDNQSKDTKGRYKLSAQGMAQLSAEIHRWADYRAKLRGTYAPTKSEHVTISELDRQLIELEALLGVQPGEAIDLVEP